MPTQTLWAMRSMPEGERPVLATARIPLSECLTISIVDACAYVGDALVDRAEELIRLQPRNGVPRGQAVYGARIDWDGAGFVVTLAFLDEDIVQGERLYIFAGAEQD